MVHNKGFSVDTDQLAEYSTKGGTLAGDITDAATARLAQHRAVPAKIFGDLGHETPLHATLTHHLGAMHDHVHALGGSVADLSDTVHTTRGDYVADEDQHARTFRTLNPED